MSNGDVTCVSTIHTHSKSALNLKVSCLHILVHLVHNIYVNYLLNSLVISFPVFLTLRNRALCWQLHQCVAISVCYRPYRIQLSGSRQPFWRLTFRCRYSGSAFQPGLWIGHIQPQPESPVRWTPQPSRSCRCSGTQSRFSDQHWTTDKPCEIRYQ